MSYFDANHILQQYSELEPLMGQLQGHVEAGEGVPDDLIAAIHHNLYWLYTYASGLHVTEEGDTF